MLRKREGKTDIEEGRKGMGECKFTFAANRALIRLAVDLYVTGVFV